MSSYKESIAWIDFYLWVNELYQQDDYGKQFAEEYVPDYITYDADVKKLPEAQLSGMTRIWQNKQY